MGFNSQELAALAAAGASGSNPYVEGNQQARIANLKALLEGQAADKAPALAGQKQAAQNEANLATLKSPEYQAILNNGGAGKAGDLSIGADPYAHLQQGQIKGDEAARQGAIKAYSAQLPKMQDTLDTMSRLTSAIQDPTRLGARGEAQGLLGRLNGVSRYVDAEGKALVPEGFAEQATNAINKLTTNGVNGLPQDEKANILGMIKDSANSLQQRHSATKDAAMQHYTLSSYANPNTAQMLGSQLGSGFEQQLGAFQKTLPQPSPNIQTPGGTAPTMNNPPGTLDRLKAFFNGGQPTQQPAPTQKPIDSTPAASNSQPDHGAALNWAKSNPKDPRSAQILQMQQSLPQQPQQGP